MDTDGTHGRPSDIPTRPKPTVADWDRRKLPSKVSETTRILGRTERDRQMLSDHSGARSAPVKSYQVRSARKVRLESSADERLAALWQGQAVLGWQGVPRGHMDERIWNRRHRLCGLQRDARHI